jgi:predicted type IV restriction endonuclease
MDLIDNLRTLAAKIAKFKSDGLLRTEEGTKNALVMPFINALGYNVFDPTEVTPELIADVGTKKGEKVDYAILKDGKPIILFECKIFGTNLNDVHASQLYRYFTVTTARFGVVTDGAVYRFYTDLDTPNIMDKDPFFIFDLSDIRESQVEELKKFSKSHYDAAGIISAASQLKYKNLLKLYLSQQTTQPSETFIKLLMSESKAYGGRFTQQMIDQFAPIVRESLRLFINEQVEHRLKAALARETEAAAVPEAEAVTPEPSEASSAIVTTQEEIEAYFIVKSILRDKIDPKRIAMRDAQSYCSILLDDNNRKPLCRLRFNGATRYIGLFNDQRAEEKVALTALDDLYKYSERLKAMIDYYEHRAAAQA